MVQFYKILFLSLLILLLLLLLIVNYGPRYLIYNPKVLILMTCNEEVTFIFIEFHVVDFKPFYCQSRCSCSRVVNKQGSSLSHV